MARFLHPVVSAQAAVPQPSLGLLFVLYAASAWLPTVVSGLLMRWNAFAVMAESNLNAYLIGFCVLQAVLLVGGVAFLAWRYPTAFWLPRVPFLNWKDLSGFLLLPLLFCNLWLGSKTIAAFERLAAFSGSPEFASGIESLHRGVWVTYGASLTGVICWSAMNFAAPVLEEILFSGLLANRFLKSLGIAAALLITPVCFAMAHLFQVRDASQLWLLAFAGVTYVSIRLASGNLFLSILSHWLINFVVLVPKWAIAWLHFRLN